MVPKHNIFVLQAADKLLHGDTARVKSDHVRCPQSIVLQGMHGNNVSPGARTPPISCTVVLDKPNLAARNGMVTRVEGRLHTVVRTK